MKFNLDFEHIFFDRYDLSDNEKVHEAEKIIEKAFKGMEYEADWEKRVFNVEPYGIESEIRLNEIIKMLKKEFFILLKIEESVKPTAKKVDCVEKAERYIRQNYLYETLSASEVSDYCKTDRKALDKAFEKRYSKTLSEYIKYVRVEETKNHIAAGGKMEDIAYLCGFGSVKTMQRSFKSVCGKTPGEYRRSLLDSKDTE